MLISRVGVNQRVPVDLIPEISSRALSLTKRNWWGPGQPINKITELRSWWIHCFLPLIPVVKAMAPHSRTLAWKIPWMEEPGRLQSMGLLRVGYDWATSLSLFTFMHWRRKWQPTPVFLPGESQGWGSLVDCSLWDHTELDTTEVT